MSEQTESTVTRRQAIGAAGVATAGLLIGARRTPVASLLGAQDAAAAGTCASLTPAKEMGPYFVEEKLNRSDVTTDPATGAVVAGVPLTLNWTLLDEDSGCAPLSGAQVDIWHAAPDGRYSDESSEGTSGNQQLRGYQVSDADGRVSFTTVYPGWYSGRAVHIHARIRIFDSSGKATYDFLTQLFFDDSLSDRVYTQAPYSARGSRDTRDAGDRVYGSDGASVLMPLTGDNAGGYTAAFTFGLSRTGSTSSATTSGTATTQNTTKATDKTVAAKLVSARFARTALGTRVLHVKVTNTEAVALDLRLLRGSKSVKHRTGSYKRSGTHLIKVAVGNGVAAGRVTLDVTVTDAAGNHKVLTKALHIPRRA